MKEDKKAKYVKEKEGKDIQILFLSMKEICTLKWGTFTTRIILKTQENTGLIKVFFFYIPFFLNAQQQQPEMVHVTSSFIQVTTEKDRVKQQTGNNANTIVANQLLQCAWGDNTEIKKQKPPSENIKCY